jgi:thiosulfate/3-mercaptopyruvate sulfurtransferase
MDPLVSTDWLAEHLGDPDLVVVDASWHMPASGRSGREEYLAAHIPGARYLDIDELSDQANPGPHMLPGAARFGEAMEQLGVGRDDRVVVYDNSPLRSAARGWFMLRHFGADQAAILDGGLQTWLAEGRPMDSGEPRRRDASFGAIERDEIVTKQQVLNGVDAPLLDARGKARFEGREPEPRPGLASGHIPASRNLPFALLYAEDGRFKPAAELRRLFAEAGIDPSQPFVASCGSGVTAGGLLFAAYLLGNEGAWLYDGSWSEWGADPATPKAVGPA